jgi:hypothetical protein
MNNATMSSNNGINNPTMSSNNSQSAWQNSYNQQPVMKQKNNNGDGKYMILGVVIAVAILVVVCVIGIIFSGSGNDGTSNSVSGITQTSSSTYNVKFQGFTFKVPTDLIYETDSDALYIGDEDGTWQASIEIVEGSFSQLQSNKNQLISIYQQQGYGAANLNEKTYSGQDFITLELTYSGSNAILGFTKANSMYVIGATAYNMDNDFDYDTFNKVASIISTASYTGETTNMKSFNKISMNGVSKLAQ